MRLSVDLHFQFSNDGFVSGARKRIDEIEWDTESEMRNYVRRKNESVKSVKSEEDNDDENDEKC